MAAELGSFLATLTWPAAEMAKKSFEGATIAVASHDGVGHGVSSVRVTSTHGTAHKGVAVAALGLSTRKTGSAASGSLDEELGRFGHVGNGDSDEGLEERPPGQWP